MHDLPYYTLSIPPSLMLLAAISCGIKPLSSSYKKMKSRKGRASGAHVCVKCVLPINCSDAEMQTFGMCICNSIAAGHPDTALISSKSRLQLGHENIQTRSRNVKQTSQQALASPCVWVSLTTVWQKGELLINDFFTAAYSSAPYHLPPSAI